MSSTTEDPAPGLLEVGALRRRVLLAGVVSLVLFVTAAYVLVAVGASDLWLLAVAVLLWVAVIRPLMRPVREATRLRRSLAYQAWLDSREEKS